MSTIDRQVLRARRRLKTNIFLQRLALGVLIAASAWSLTLLVERLFVLGIPILHGLWVVAVIGAVTAILGTVFSPVSPLVAAVAIDQAAGLKERISTALAVRRAADPFARAVVHDAEHVAGRVHVPAHLPLRPPTLWPWSAAMVLVALLLGLFMPTLNLLAAEEKGPPVDRAAVEAERQAIAVQLEQRLERIRELAQQNENLKDLARDLPPLELPEKPTVTPDDIRREAAAKIDRVADRLEKEKLDDKFDVLRETKRRMAGLQPKPGNDPAAKLSEALKDGDFAGAKKALEEMQKELERSARSDDPESRRQTAEMARKLAELAEQMKQAADTTRLQKELENKVGLSAEDARKLLDQLSQMDPKQLEKELQKRLGDTGLSQQQIQELARKIQQQQQAQQQCQNLGQCISQLAQALQQMDSQGGGAGGAQATADAMADAMSQMSQMEMLQQQLAEIEAQLNDLKSLREGVCQGGFCPGDGLGENGRIGPQGPNYGLGFGSRIGREATAHKIRPTQVKSRGRGGEIIGQMLVDGPQLRGEAQAEVREAVNSAVRDAEDAIERDAIPRQYDRVLREYFERLAGLVGERSKPDGNAEPAKPSGDGG